MQITIQESPFSDFDKINTIAVNGKLFFGNLVNLTSVNHVINSCRVLANRRPKVKKVGIYSRITLKKLETDLSEDTCQKILRQYIQSIGWHDLQYVVFLDTSLEKLEFHIVFNRITPEGYLIDLNCIGAKWPQYERLLKAISDMTHVIPNLSSKEFRGKLLEKSLDYKNKDSSLKGKSLRSIFELMLNSGVSL
jgi:hypothetical protein